jgi:dephospho-CoA kinase
VKGVTGHAIDKPIIGLAGGIGSGKSTVAHLLSGLGAAVISSDRLNQEELESQEVRQWLGRRFGSAVFHADGRVNRQVLRQIVSTDPEARRELEQRLHPRINHRREALMAQYQADPNVRAVVWDSPLLFETGLAHRCDRVIFVEADDRVRAERVRARGWSPEELRRFEQMQEPLDSKRKRADYRVVNNSDIDSLRQQVEDVFSRIVCGA